MVPPTKGAFCRAVLIGAALTLWACGRGQTDSAASGAQNEGATPPVDSLRAGDLVASAENVVGFLRGRVDFAQIRLADSVTLYLAPESGGGQSRIARAHLADPANWIVRTERGQSYSFVPPNSMTRLTTRVGTHFNCMEYPLVSRIPQLANHPHVGTMMQAEDAGGCLHTWNLTVVFDADEAPPRVIAAVYDQWEW